MKKPAYPEGRPVTPAEAIHLLEEKVQSLRVLSEGLQNKAAQLIREARVATEERDTARRERDAAKDALTSGWTVKELVTILVVLGRHARVEEAARKLLDAVSRMPGTGSMDTDQAWGDAVGNAANELEEILKKQA